MHETPTRRRAKRVVLALQAKLAFRNVVAVEAAKAAVKSNQEAEAALEALADHNAQVGGQASTSFREHAGLALARVRIPIPSCAAAASAADAANTGQPVAPPR